MGIAGNCYELTHPSLSGPVSLAVENESRCPGGLRTYEGMVQVGTCTEREIRQATQSVPCRPRTDGGECAAMVGVHGLQQVVARLVADLAHDDAVLTLIRTNLLDALRQLSIYVARRP